MEQGAGASGGGGGGYSRSYGGGSGSGSGGGGTTAPKVSKADAAAAVRKAMGVSGTSGRKGNSRPSVNGWYGIMNRRFR